VRLDVVRAQHDLCPFGKEVLILKVKQPNEPFLGRPVSLDCSIWEHMLNVRQLRPQVAANEDHSVTPDRIRFGAQQSHGMGFNPRDYPAEASAERLGARQPVVVNSVLVTESWIVGTSTQFRAQEDVMNPMVGKKTRQALSVEVWRPPAVRNGSDVGNCGDSMPQH
jgi:hypothetical protein